MVAAQHAGLAEGWVFPTEKGKLYKGHPLRPVLEAALAACKIDRRVTPHGLRHTANNELRRVANGEVVRAIIGHTTEAMTHHYSHVGEDEKRDAVARVFAIVRGGAGVVSGVVDSGSKVDPATSENEKLRDVAELRGGATQI
jgi:integrase